jgi:uncharacterized protein (TIGR03085 family)
MSSSNQARRERRELAELLLAQGPDAPTLCGDWTTKDLAAHLVVRESRPDAGIGLVLSPLSGWTDRVTRATATQSYPELVRKVRTGPPTLSVFSLPGAEGLANLVEYFVHHEDVRRAQPGWEPRELPPEQADELWSRVRQMSRMTFRRVPVGVTLERTDGAGGSCVARSGEPMVTLRGAAQELLLRSYGRAEAQVEVIGDAEAVEAFEAAPISV